MKIICNGKEMEVRVGLTVGELILELELNPDTVVVECDGCIVIRGNYMDQPLSEDSVVELIRFVGGG
jgi:sulfur carrier protein